MTLPTTTLPFGPVPQPPPAISGARVFVQVYRGAIHGATPLDKRDALARHCARLKTLGVDGVVFHGFCEDLARNWDSLVPLAVNAGLTPLASWGLDSKDITAERKGALVGDVLRRPTCAAGLLDAEGQWDTDSGPADDMDEAGALALCKAIRAKAPNAWVGDQPWYAIDSHGDVRRTAKPVDQGGVFGGFPVDEFATVANWGRYRQMYLYPETGYAYTAARMDREWATITPALRAAGLERPLRVTIQAYRWRLNEQVHCLLDRGVRPDVPVVMWAEPMPDATSEQAIRAVKFLVASGYARPGIDATEAVKAFQRTRSTLTADGQWGPLTHAAAGL